MIERVERAFQQYAERIAYRTEEGAWSFRALWETASGYASALTNSRKPVLVIGDKEPHMIAGFLACLMVSRPYVPCDSATPAERISEIQQWTGADAVIDAQTPIGERKAISFSYNESDVVYILCTSGSTGVPKAVPIRGKNLNAFLDLLLSLDALQSVKGKVMLNQARYCFDLSVADLYFSICTGTQLYALSSRQQHDFSALVQGLCDSRASAAVMTPTFARYCLCLPEFDRAHLPNLSCIFFCGEPLAHSTVRKLFERFDGLRILNAYGPTEATCAVCASEITKESLSGEHLPCGEIRTASCSVTIEDGEIVLSGASVFDGYLHAETTVARYKTGDRGRIENGKLYCLGRLYGYIKYGGHRIEPEEIRTAIVKLDAVEQCAVHCVTDADGTVQKIRATVVSETLDAEEIRTALKQKLPAYMIPKSIIVQPKMTFSSNFKQEL